MPWMDLAEVTLGMPTAEPGLSPAMAPGRGLGPPGAVLKLYLEPLLNDILYYLIHKTLLKFKIFISICIL
jgi:hypothetical protein